MDHGHPDNLNVYEYSSNNNYGELFHNTNTSTNILNAVYALL